MEMDKKELQKSYDKLDRVVKALLLEKLAFCKFADQNDFENYFRIKELKSKGFKDKEISVILSSLFGFNKNEVYKKSLSM